MLKISETICAVIVTYNRSELLKGSVDAVRNQSLKPDAIIVINNGSTDGTEEWLSQQTDIITYTQENVGGAGGFYSGMKMAFESNYDWIWILDDDVFADKICLQSLINVDGPIKVPLRIGKMEENFNDLPAAYYNLKNPFKRNPRRLINKDLNINKFSDLPEVLDVDDFAFEGPLFKRDVIAKVGYPLKDLFIFHDDTEYSLRCLRKFHLKVKLVKSAKMYRQLEDKIQINWKIYYRFRNITLVHVLYGENVFVKIKPLFLFAISLIKNIFLFPINNERANVIKYRLWAVRDGYLKKFIKRF